MITTVIDIQRVFKDVWGYIALPYPEILIKRFLVGKPQFEQEYEEFKKYRQERKQCSDKGVPIYHSEGKHTDLFLPVWLSDKDDASASSKYLLPLTMMDMTCKKNIVTTPLVNRDGTVKEEVSRDDWELNIRGVMVGEGNSYPDDLVQLLHDWWQKSKSLRIENVKTAICMDGENVVITSIKFPEVRGNVNLQPYELKLVSDLEFSLYL